MNSPAPLTHDVETVAELRALYRAAEARAARLRFLTNTGRILSEQGDGDPSDALNRCVRQLAFFLGSPRARLTIGSDGPGMPVPAPGGGSTLARVLVSGIDDSPVTVPEEDRETVRLFLEMLGTALDRQAREEERAELIATLRDRERQLEEMVERILEAQEYERLYVSRELHDGVAQTATALARLIEGSKSATGDLAVDERARLAGIARGLVGELRGVIAGLRPTMLDDLGLVEAIRALADELRIDGYEVELTVDPPATPLGKPLEVALFRVAQEAATNIRKHAGGPCRVEIDLELGSRASRRYLRIADTGTGAAPEASEAEAPGRQIGVRVMEERMASIGGSLSWDSAPGRGVTLIATLPDASAA